MKQLNDADTSALAVEIRKQVKARMATPEFARRVAKLNAKFVAGENLNNDQIGKILDLNPALVGHALSLLADGFSPPQSGSGRLQ